MPRGYLAELVSVDTEDDYTLNGMVVHPPVSGVKPRPIVWIHGYGGSFFSTTQARLSLALAARGFTFIAGNNRGTGFGTTILKKGPRSREQDGKLAGAGWERFSESEHDVAAWIGFAQSLGFPEVILLGHSYGGIKVTYYQGRRQDPRVKGLICASPWARIRRDLYSQEAIHAAEQRVAAGRGEEMMVVKTEDEHHLSAGAYLDLWRSNVDVFGFDTEEPLVSRIACPLFVFYGTAESWIGDAYTLEHIKRQAKASPRVSLTIFDGADHWYQGVESDVANAIAAFAAELK